MSAQDLTLEDGEPPEDLAGAYVLGVLGPEEWRAAHHRVATDPDFAVQVEQWHAWLAPLAAAVDSHAPPRDLWPDIRRALPVNDNSFGNVSLWRGLTAASGVIAAACLAVVVMSVPQRPNPVAPPPASAPDLATAEPLQVALLKPKSGPTAFVATLDRTRKVMTVSPGAAPAPQGRSLELWMIAPGGKPQALGVIPSDHAAKMPMPDAFAGQGETPVVLAVSIEPKGGSPTGQPTGPVVASGRFAAV